MQTPNKIFGNHLLILKLNWILILFTGLFSVFKIANHFLKHKGFSLLVATVLFLSPVFTFYSVAFLPDPLALNIAFVGLWFLLKSTLNTKSSTIILAMVFLSIAGMIKPFFLIPYLAFLCTVIFNQFLYKVKGFKWLYLIPLMSVGIWFYYTNWYNSSVFSHYFLSEATPIWNNSEGNITQTWTAITDKWFKDYIHPTFFWILITMLCGNLIWWKKDQKEINLFFLFSVLGAIMFGLLFFNMLRYHDYYIYPILYLIPLTIGIFIYKMSLQITSCFNINFTTFNH